jgi:hypothetical protein
VPELTNGQRSAPAASPVTLASLAKAEQLLEQAASAHDPQTLAAAIDRLADVQEHIVAQAGPALLDRLIGTLRRAESIAADQGNVGVLVAHNNLCGALLRRYEITRDASDLDRAVAGFRALLEVLTEPGPDRASVQENLATALRECFVLRHDINDLRAEVDLRREAAQQTPPASALYARRSAVLVLSARNLYEVSGDLADLDQVISALRAALVVQPGNAPMRLDMLDALLGSCQDRYARTQDAADLDSVIDAAKACIDALPLGHPGRHLLVLFQSLSIRYDRTHDPDDLDRAIAVAEEAAAQLPPGSPDHRSMLSAVASALRFRYDRDHDAGDLSRAAHALTRLLDVTAQDAQGRDGIWESLAQTRHEQYLADGDPRHLDDEVDAWMAAVTATPPRATTSGTGVPEPDQYGLARLLGLVNARRQVIQTSGNLGNASTSEVGNELNRLRDAIDADRDIEAARIAGLMYFFRSIAVTDLDERGRCFVEALVLLRPVSRRGHGVIPEPLAEVFQNNPRWLADDWLPALSADAIGIAHTHDDQLTLSISVALLRKGLQLIPDAAPGRDASGHDYSHLRFEYLSNLGLSLRRRSELTGSATDLAEALNIAEACLRQTSETSPDRAPVEFNTSLAYRDRHQLTNSADDLDQWLVHAREAVKSATAGDASRATLIENLVNAQQKSVDSGRLSDGNKDAILDEIISATIPDAAREQTASQAEISEAHNRAAALISRYERRGHPEDLDEAITVLQHLVDQPSLADPERAGCFSNLGIALMKRYDLREAALDLEEGFAAARSAVNLAPEDHPRRPMYTSNLSLLALTYAERHGSAAADLDLAVDAARAAVAATPADDMLYAAYLSNLATALKARSRRTPNPADLDEAVSLSETAAALNRDRAKRGHFEAGVAFAKLYRYRETHSPSDLDDVIARSHETLAILGSDEPGREMVLLGLAQALMARHRPGDLAACAVVAQEATNMVGAALTTRLAAAQGWADVASELGDWPLACRAFADIGDLLNMIGSTHLSRADQEYAASHIAGLPSRAAAAHLEAGDPEGAVEVFERSHAVLLSHQLGTQLELRALAKAEPDLADEYRKLRGRLAFLEEPEPGMLVSAGPTGTLPGRGPEALARERAQLLQRLDATLARIRTLDGFGAFASGPAAQDLYRAASGCPVVLFSISDKRSDALILMPSAVEVVPLHHVSPQLVQEKAMLLWGAIDDAQRNYTGLGTSAFAEHLVHEILGWLWDCVTGPVLNRLGFNGPPQADGRWPTVCWCPSGFLTLLPLHASGHHQARPDEGPQTVMDRVVSTYTPTVRSLQPSIISDHAKTYDLVVVAMPSTPGHKDLPGAAIEASTLRTLFGDRARLLGEVNGGSPATIEAVLQALPSSRRAHFACHALSDIRNPSSSRLLLAEGNEHPLTFRELMSLDLDGAELAYLSACATARPHPGLLDEVVHMASTFTLVGYAHVIATLWPVGDKSAVFVAERFYRGMRLREDSADAAIALHAAIRQLRDSVPARPSKWAAYIHVGRAVGLPSRARLSYGRDDGDSDLRSRQPGRYGGQEQVELAVSKCRVSTPNTAAAPLDADAKEQCFIDACQSGTQIIDAVGQYGGPRR